MLKLPVNYTVLISPIVIIWYTFTELGSIIENAGSLGTPIPALKDATADAADKLTTDSKNK